MLQVALHSGPGERFLSGALVHSLQDSIRVKSPLPGGLSALFRFAFNLPQWLQISAAALGSLLALGLLVLIWVRRAAIIGWLKSRSRPLTLGLAIVGSLAMVGFAGGNAYIWHYTQHDNGFCVGCHVMNPAYTRFTQSEHSKLECHSCHEQPISASIWQLVVWVAERPDKIPPHARVPNGICARCHITGQKEIWQRIATTAGHRVHLESDSSALRGVQCVTCHGVEVHRFAPVSQTCGQAGCHESVKITLGKMASQTSLHCVACHKFTAEVPLLATRDSAAGTLVPREQQCMGCHQMQKVLANFDAAKDPHNGTCGDCHNPHTQHVAADAAKTCASSGCHSDWRKVPFHTGVRHANVASQCTLCHEPHQARVDPSDCAGCHQAVKGRKSGHRTLTPPLPFDTARALRGAMLPPPDDPPRGKGDMPPPRNQPPRVAAALSSLRAPFDTFPHSRHTKLACLTCHASEREHGKLTFEPPRGCQICHHQQAAQSNCATCHTTQQLSTPFPVTLRLAVAGVASRQRSVPFDHSSHSSRQCVECHTTPVSLAPAPEVAACSSCHTDHHAAARSCATCHSGTGMVQAHRPGSASHTGCNGCHPASTISLLVPDRSLCLTCHAAQRDHYAARECTTCHFQSTPEAFRQHLVKSARRS